MRAPKGESTLEATDVKEDKSESDLKIENVVTPEESGEPIVQPASQDAEDTTMAEAFMPATAENEAGAKETEPTQPAESPNQKISDTALTAKEPVSTAPEAESQAEQLKSEAVPAPAQKAPEEEAPLSAAISQDINFESMFDEPLGDDAGGDMNNDFNFDLDLPGPDMAGADLGGAENVNSTTAHDTNMTNDPTSFNSLLPGLESYANEAGDDFGGLDLTQSGPDTDGNMTGKDHNFEGMPQMQGSNAFDELIGDGTLGEGLGNLEGDGMDDLFNDDALMELGDLDDTWLKNDNRTD